MDAESRKTGGVTHFDLFSGIGGNAIAAGWAGLDTVGFSELEPYACKILKQTWPDVKNYGDIKGIKGADIVAEHVTRSTSSSHLMRPVGCHVEKPSSVGPGRISAVALVS